MEEEYTMMVMAGPTRTDEYWADGGDETDAGGDSEEQWSGRAHKAWEQRIKQTQGQGTLDSEGHRNTVQRRAKGWQSG